MEQIIQQLKKLGLGDYEAFESLKKLAAKK